MLKWPDWKDVGKRVRLTLADGKAVEGVLYIEDQFLAGDDEVPVFGVRRDDGSNWSFAEHETWEFVAES